MRRGRRCGELGRGREGDGPLIFWHFVCEILRVEAQHECGSENIHVTVILNPLSLSLSPSLPPTPFLLPPHWHPFTPLPSQHVSSTPDHNYTHVVSIVISCSILEPAFVLSPTHLWTALMGVVVFIPVVCNSSHSLYWRGEGHALSYANACHNALYPIYFYIRAL